ncbi:hypothetical protein D3C87_1945820 [compost metagenome]
MLGSLMACKKRSRRPISRGTSWAWRVWSECCWLPILTLRPSMRSSRVGTSGATRSTTWALTASSASRLTASRTAFSAHSALRPRDFAMPRM